MIRPSPLQAALAGGVVTLLVAGAVLVLAAGGGEGEAKRGEGAQAGASPTAAVANATTTSTVAAQGSPAATSAPSPTPRPAGAAPAPTVAPAGPTAVVDPPNRFFVSVSTGRDSNSGRRDAPFESIGKGTEAARAAGGGAVLVAGGRYQERLVPAPRTTIRGGYNPATWTLDPTGPPSEVATNDNVLRIVDVADVTVEGLTLRATQQATGSAVPVVVLGSSNVRLVNLSIFAGPGADSIPGLNGITGPKGQTGSKGEDAGGCPNPGGAGAPRRPEASRGPKAVKVRTASGGAGRTLPIPLASSRPVGTAVGCSATDTMA